MLIRISIVLVYLSFIQIESSKASFYPSKKNVSIIEDSLIAYYRFNGDVSDDIGEHHGTIRGAEFTTDRFSSTLSAFRFDGEEEHLNLNVDYTDAYDSLSISIWIYPFDDCTPTDTFTIDTSQNQYFISSGGIDQSTGIYGIWNKGSLLVGQSLPTSHSVHEYHSFLDNNQWHHIVMLYDAIEKVVDVHINGEWAFSLEHLLASSPSLSDSLIIGMPNFIGGQGFNGKVDEVRIYNRKLSEEKITELYQEYCPDTLTFEKIHIQSDTIIYADVSIQIDTLSIDTACTLNLITPVVFIQDSSLISPISKTYLWAMPGCKHTESVHDQHVSHRGIYINNFVTDDILGDALKEDSLLTWCIQQDFNNIYLYNIGTALSSGMQMELDSFIHKSNNQSIHITFVSAGYGTSFDNIVDYHKDYNHLPQGMVSEIEFWNGSGNYDIDYAPWLARLDSLKYIPILGDSSALNPLIQRRFYIGKIKNPGDVPSIEIAEDLVTHHDEIFLTNYHSNAYDLSTSSSENSIRNKLSLLAKAGKNIGQKVNIVILFNVRQDSPAPNIWSYYSVDNSNHDFRAGFEKWYQDFITATDIDHKEYINIMGYGMYRWTDAKEAR